jgi:hypothetical protein
MALMPIDSVQRLEEAELPPGAARAIVRVITNHVDTAVSGLATRDDLERLRLATKHDADELLASMNSNSAEFKSGVDRDSAAFRASMRHDFVEFQASMHRDFAEFQASMHRDFAEFQARMCHELAEFRIHFYRLLIKGSLGVFGAVLTAYAPLAYYMFQQMAK